MVIIRPTISLAKRAKIKLVSESREHSTTKLGDWYAIDVVLDRKQYILCLSEHARISVVLPAAPYSDFYKRLTEKLPEVLRALGIATLDIEHEIFEMGDASFGKATNRSLTGSLIDFRKQLEWRADFGRFQHGDLVKEALLLCEIPMLISKSGRGIYPEEEVKRIFSSVEPKHKKPTLRLVT